MKKILNFLGTITLIVISTTSLITCNKLQYSEKQLKELKEKNNINTKNGILEWIAPQQKPFNNIDNKYYFVIWRGNKNTDWHIIKFKNNTNIIKINNYDNYQLEKTDLGVSMGKSLYITNKSGFIKYVTTWPKDNGSYFKSIYRWNNDSNPNTPIILPKTGKIID